MTYKNTLHKLSDIWELMIQAKDNGHFDYKEAMQLGQQFQDIGAVDKAKEVRKWAARIARERNTK